MAFLGMRPGEVCGGGWEHPPGPIMMWGAAAPGSALLGMPFLSSVLCMGSVGDCWDPPSNIGVSAAAEGGGQGGDKVMGTRGFGLWQYLTAPNELQQLPPEEGVATAPIPAAPRLGRDHHPFGKQEGEATIRAG